MSDTERSIQKRLQHRCIEKQHDPMSHNSFLYSWESDFLSITRTGYVHEYEIKISKSDFKADFKKVEKHQVLQHGYYIRKRTICVRGTASGKMRYPIIEKQIICKRPNYFWYVCPPNLILKEDIPAYAGLMYNTTPIVKAPLLHKTSVTDKELITVYKSLYHRYWKNW